MQVTQIRMAAPVPEGAPGDVIVVFSREFLRRGKITRKRLTGS
jgi:hypothetical protein